jgi:hypothetical protein
MTKLPKRTSSQKIGESAADLLSSVFTEICNVIPVPQSRDLGIDFICEVMEKEYPTGKLFNIQCKGTDDAEIRSDSIRIPISVTTLNYWLLQPNPTFLVLVDRQKRHFYWTFPRFFLESVRKNWQEQQEVSIPIPAQNRFDEDISALPEELVLIVNKHASAKPRIDYLGTLKLYYSSIIIDGIFINDAILEAQRFYSKLYPDKDLQIPNIYAVIDRLLQWSQIKSKSRIFCYLIRPNAKLYELPGIVYLEKVDFNDELTDEVIDFNAEDFKANEMGGKSYEFIVNDFTTKDFVWAEIEALVNRFVNVEEVLLVAHDPAYSYLFQQMEKKGIEIVWARYQFGFKSGFDCFDQYYYPLKWINVLYPIAEAMGLEHHEW